MSHTLQRVVLLPVVALVVGCGAKSAVTNGGLPPQSVSKVGTLSTDKKVQVGSVMFINMSDFIALRKSKMQKLEKYVPSRTSIPKQYQHP